jgi:hypothetical protein
VFEEDKMFDLMVEIQKRELTRKELKQSFDNVIPLNKEKVWKV